ncbi:lamin tail domain-containing protein [Herbiconiux moechotypicola]|uniref:LTD domain-containing protein n=1 Tax=Herbiconiux moechotypicola TaxID=637393 RepID=A0ABN3DQH0_9MICO|nr:lamin tail domain-containing protein [Herbiconiux moechotypicola]MCS5731447.1 lamin tail domain-containing protein [Herbiconiux moechotypicola]
MRASRVPIAALAALAVVVAPFTALVPAVTASAVPDYGVTINEVESNGGSPGDWVELANTSATAQDVSGWKIKDNDDTHVFTVPANTSIAAGGFLALDVETAYGLGAADSARVYLADGTTLVDSYSWTSHASTTYGRCPDGTGAFTTTLSSTKGGANACVVDPATVVRINEVESNGGTPGDWVELKNNGTASVNVGGLIVKDNDDTHVFMIPANTTIAAGGFLALDVETAYGLGSADSARLFAANGTTLIDSYSWTSHASTTYGRCPDGTGAFTTTTSSTKGAANACGSTTPTTPVTAVKLNEVESTGGTPGDWVELVNTGTGPVDVSGLVVKDNDDTHVFTIPANTTIAARGFLALDVETAYGLGSADSARLFGADGTTLLDSYSWTAHATGTTYGRCPDGTGAWTTTTTVTKGAANDCSTPPAAPATTWPGSASIAYGDQAGVLGGNMSGLAYEPSGTAASGVLWAVKNGPGTLYRMLWNGTAWVADTANGWASGKTLRYGNGSGDPDAEGVALTDAGVAGGVYVSTERNNSASGVSKPAVLRFDAAGSGSATTLSATTEWDLTADLPGLGANLGLEAIEWIPDSYLVAQGFVDQRTGRLYDPASYANHGEGLFFVGVEQNGAIYAYALDQSGTSYTRVATFASGFAGVMDLEFDPERSALWAVCDDTCQGRSATLQIAQSGASDGSFVATEVFERPAGMPNYNNEGFAIAPQATCVAGSKMVVWANDSNDESHALRVGSIECTVPVPADTTAPSVSYSLSGRTLTVSAGDAGSGVASIEVALDGGAWAVYSAPIVFDDAAHTVRIRATDVQGNVSGERSVSVVPVAPVGPPSLEAQGAARTIAPGGTASGLGARVVDSASSPIAGTTVTFTLSGPGSFPGGGTGSSATSATAVTNAAGVALAPVVTGASAGAVVVTASAAGATSIALPAVTVAEPAPTVTADVSVVREVVSGKVVLTVFATNTSSEAATVLLKTKYGTKTVTGIAAGATVSQAFKTYLASVPAGDATVTLTIGSDVRSYTVPYTAG